MHILVYHKLFYFFFEFLSDFFTQCTFKVTGNGRAHFMDMSFNIKSGCINLIQSRILEKNRINQRTLAREERSSESLYLERGAVYCRVTASTVDTVLLRILVGSTKMRLQLGESVVHHSTSTEATLELEILEVGC